MRVEVSDPDVMPPELAEHVLANGIDHQLRTD